jgi:hypothetical protein
MQTYVLFIQHLLSTYSMLGTVLGAKDTGVNDEDKTPCPLLGMVITTCNPSTQEVEAEGS